MTQASLVCIIIALACYGLSFLCCCLKKKGIAKGLFYAGFGFNFCLFILNFCINGYPPFANIYQVLGDLGLCFLPLYFYMKSRQRSFFWLPYFSAASMVVMIGVLSLVSKNKEAWSLAPALDSFYFVPHVLAYMLSYALIAVAFLLLLSRKNKKEEHRKAVYEVMHIGVFFSTLGMCLGALWADMAWGAAWNWDMKEIWALITLLLSLAYCHAYKTKGMEKWEKPLVSMTFVCMLLTFFFVNIFPKILSHLEELESLHLYE